MRTLFDPSARRAGEVVVPWYLLDVKDSHKPRHSRREEAHCILNIGSQSLLTSAATIQGFHARSSDLENSRVERKTR